MSPAVSRGLEPKYAREDPSSLRCRRQRGQYISEFSSTQKPTIIPVSASRALLFLGSMGSTQI